MTPKRRVGCSGPFIGGALHPLCNLFNTEANVSQGCAKYSSKGKKTGIWLFYTLVLFKGRLCFRRQQCEQNLSSWGGRQPLAPCWGPSTCRSLSALAVCPAVAPLSGTWLDLRAFGGYLRVAAPLLTRVGPTILWTSMHQWSLVLCWALVS